MEELEEFLTTEPREKVHMVEEHNAHAYRLAQTQEFLDLFQAAHRGRPARTVEELEEWAGSPEGKQVVILARSDSATPHSSSAPDQRTDSAGADRHLSGLERTWGRAG